ncbi:hypothetical protein PCL_01138 [Purpureocillium lilacinum]|uniref:Uncharacterized protein n=1 Tax=Purpureocillium lilacinum TaxID=33203 RepID=A0A2U3E4Q0_PURLI|nr:hypothetical protein PCL_01138 [Purpureocillium lilacinum]
MRPPSSPCVRARAAGRSVRETDVFQPPGGVIISLRRRRRTRHPRRPAINRPSNATPRKSNKSSHQSIRNDQPAKMEDYYYGRAGGRACSGTRRRPASVPARRLGPRGKGCGTSSTHSAWMCVWTHPTGKVRHAGEEGRPERASEDCTVPEKLGRVWAPHQARAQSPQKWGLALCLERVVGGPGAGGAEVPTLASRWAAPERRTSRAGPPPPPGGGGARAMEVHGTNGAPGGADDDEADGWPRGRTLKRADATKLGTNAVDGSGSAVAAPAAAATAALATDHHHHHCPSSAGPFLTKQHLVSGTARAWCAAVHHHNKPFRLSRQALPSSQPVNQSAELSSPKPGSGISAAHLANLALPPSLSWLAPSQRQGGLNNSSEAAAPSRQKRDLRPSPAWSHTYARMHAHMSTSQSRIKKKKKRPSEMRISGAVPMPGGSSLDTIAPTAAAVTAASHVGHRSPIAHHALRTAKRTSQSSVMLSYAYLACFTNFEAWLAAVEKPLCVDVALTRRIAAAAAAAAAVASRPYLIRPGEPPPRADTLAVAAALGGRSRSWSPPGRTSGAPSRTSLNLTKRVMAVGRRRPPFRRRLPRQSRPVAVNPGPVTPGRICGDTLMLLYVARICPRGAPPPPLLLSSSPFQNSMTTAAASPPARHSPRPAHEGGPATAASLCIGARIVPTAQPSTKRAIPPTGRKKQKRKMEIRTHTQKKGSSTRKEPPRASSPWGVWLAVCRDNTQKKPVERGGRPSRPLCAPISGRKMTKARRGSGCRPARQRWD